VSLKQKRVFFVGISSVGKTPMLEAITQRLQQEGVPHVLVYAGGWVRDRVQTLQDRPKVQLTPLDKTLMASTTVEILRSPEGGRIPIEWMEKQCENHPLVLIDGVRNPDDYAALWRPGDATILFSRTGDPEVKGLKPRSDFERWGVPAVSAYAEFRQFLHPESTLLRVCIPALTLFEPAHYEQVYQAVRIGE
jgi:GTPase SAR1 family protein